MKGFNKNGTISRLIPGILRAWLEAQTRSLTACIPLTVQEKAGPPPWGNGHPQAACCFEEGDRAVGEEGDTARTATSAQSWWQMRAKITKKESENNDWCFLVQMITFGREDIMELPQRAD